MMRDREAGEKVEGGDGLLDISTGQARETQRCG